VPTEIGWTQVAIRLALTVLAGTLIGINRSSRGRPAGLRTTLLVCLAASISMIQANLLMDTAGKSSSSFVVLDLMRLPLGILSGMGFIGAGAILRRDNMVVGITTAATLWFVTIIGLCFGGGQLFLGLCGLALGLAVLWGLKWVEEHSIREHIAELVVVTAAEGPSEEEIRSRLTAQSCIVASSSVAYSRDPDVQRFEYALEWRARLPDARVPGFLPALAQQPGVIRVEWKSTAS
jgi:putative Mg2+ transporter-C (MgtC) family protein